jgi:hypothetical protein
MVASLPPLISVHIPKAGGTSTLDALQAAYGDAFSQDYADDPGNPMCQRLIDPARYFERNVSMPPGVKCIHGHFHPGKFNIAKDTVLFTLLRHPVDNLISIYFFWKALGPSPGAELLNYFCANNLNIVETAKLPQLRWLLSKCYFEGFDMDRFDLIGRHEARASAFAKLSQLIGHPLKCPHSNITPESEERQAAADDSKLRAQLEDILVDDIRFYERYAR